MSLPPYKVFQVPPRCPTSVPCIRVGKGCIDKKRVFCTGRTSTFTKGEDVMFSVPLSEKGCYLSQERLFLGENGDLFLVDVPLSYDDILSFRTRGI